MINLQKTTDLVVRELEQDLYLLELLKDDLINVRALARRLLPRIQKENRKATIPSISVAVQRYVSSQKKRRISAEVAGIIARSQLSTKNDVVHITFKRNEHILARVSEISQQVNWGDDEIFFVNQGSGEVTIILDKKNLALLTNCRKDEIEFTDNVTIISIKEVLEDNLARSIDIPGIYAYFIRQLARHGINIISVISTYTQITFAFAEKDFLRAYAILDESISYHRAKITSCSK